RSRRRFLNTAGTESGSPPYRPAWLGRPLVRPRRGESPRRRSACPESTPATCMSLLVLLVWSEVTIRWGGGSGMSRFPAWARRSVEPLPRKSQPNRGSTYASYGTVGSGGRCLIRIRVRLKLVQFSGTFFADLGGLLAAEHEEVGTSGAPPEPAAGAIYDQLPYGLVIVDEQGSVLRVNPAALEMGWRFGESDPPTACYEMFDCRRSDGPCHHGCLAQRAAQTGETLPEIRIDTRSASGISAVWLTTH